ncbi:polysaccharide deacetylase family protein [Pseudonocardia sp. RS11V-5]|uniref:polysaccharide deacetylase family protein n=1 Tax=Pseudonocardia terrae TaxID=2905831 RepID=UPI001E3FC538|nr:polysaccharide deacetylase family protein [Pseudonocardia terrae]MCE3551748.1 polysaccharide deacetylase family protein [Pseudonocardia terrae]
MNATVRRTTLRWSLLGAGAAAGSHLLPAASWLPPVRRLLPGLSGRGAAGHVALTFDDGPSPPGTAAVRDALAGLGVRATFFVLGRELARNPDLGRELAAAGHEIAVHGWDHGYLLGRGRRRVRDELAHTRDLIGETCGTTPRWFRPAFGVLTGPAVCAAHELGLRPVLWTAWGKDWTATATADSVVRRLEPGLVGGATLLLHDVVPGPVTAAALPRLAALAAERALTLGPLGEHGVPS